MSWPSWTRHGLRSTTTAPWTPPTTSSSTTATTRSGFATRTKSSPVRSARSSTRASSTASSALDFLLREGGRCRRASFCGVAPTPPGFIRATAIRAGGERMATTKKKGGQRNGAALMEAPTGLKAGSSGNDVELLQNYLIRFGYLAAPPAKGDGRVAELDLRPKAAPGEFDEATEEALRHFQERAGIPVT